MNPTLPQAQEAIRNAREALRSGDHSAARRWAEQAAQLAPQLEDPWLILAAVASPRASVSFIQRALQINPDSPRARKGMQWALKRLQEEPSAQKTAETTKQVKSVVRSIPKEPAGKVASKKASRTPIFPILLLVLGCIAIIFAAWTASTTPVLASILSGVSQPEEDLHPRVWARVEIAKPVQVAEPAPVLVEAVPTLPAPTATLPPPTPEPTAAPPTSTPEPDLEP
ncbi:MAG: hypothetical protein JW963_11455, partial [Anaerolineales bacterium]|nr:hypothetical protein [Anaerolineales bacterium]